MQALILATDESSELRSLTERLPASMLPVVNRPVMAYTVEMLARAGCREIGVSLHRMAGSVEAYFGTGSRWGVRLTYLLQREPLGSAGALKWAASGLRGTFIVLPGDGIVDFDLDAALAFHRSHGGPATLIVHKPGSGCPARPVAVAPGGRVASLAGQPALPDVRVLADTGAYIFEPQVLDFIPPGLPFACYEDLLPELLSAGPLHAYLMDGYWNPLNSVAAYRQAQLAVLASATGMAPQGEFGECPLRYASIQGRHIAPGIVIGRGVAIHPTARLAPPLYIGSGCQVERDVELGPEAVIGSNVIVDEGATIRDSTVLKGTYVGRLVQLDSRVVDGGLVIDANTGDSLPIVDPFLLGEVSPETIVGLLARLADFAGALVMLILWFPAIVLIALVLLLIKLFSGDAGPILEHRPRVRWRHACGTDQAEMETYHLLHFRTRRDETRFLPLGRWLERSQLDRLPALWNVLAGDLRLVGVKPLDPDEARRLSEKWQRGCYEQRAGFTGLWYVHPGGDLDLDDAVAADLYYAATRTPLEDLRLLLRTPAARTSGGSDR